MMQRLVASVMIHHDARGTRVLLRHPLQGGSDRALHTAGAGRLNARAVPWGVGEAEIRCSIYSLSRSAPSEALAGMSW